jgi:[FeFe] hydrogenase H-cluster maturation GTPase HydF
MSGLQATPRGNRLHIGIFGRRNAGKSSFINRLVQQDLAIVSPVAGTTADPVYKSIEIHPIGPCVLIDTAGFDDTGELGSLRVAKTKEAAAKTDVAIILIGADHLIIDQVQTTATTAALSNNLLQSTPLDEEKAWLSYFKERKTPVLYILNKAELITVTDSLLSSLEQLLGQPVLAVSASTGSGFNHVKEALLKLPLDFEQESLTGHLVKAGDSVLLVMPQDLQAPKGRLILPQVQVIRDLLDLGAIPTAVTTDKLEQALSLLAEPPALIITDSQVFKQAFAQKPAASRITSFSVLLARYKGDIEEFVSGAAAIEALQITDRVLIAEACSHDPLDGDIGRIKIPALLRKKVGEGLQIDVVGGRDFPDDLSPYALIIHCGACMFNRRHVLSRINQAQQQGVPITNYGIAIAQLNGILEHVEK